MYLRTGRRVAPRFRARSTVQRFWCDSSSNPASTAITDGTPQLFALDAALNTDYSARKTGATVLRIVGCIAAVPTVAAAAGTCDLLNAGIVLRSNTETAANADPWSTTGRVMRWMHQEHFAFPATAAAPAGTVMTSPVYRNIDIRVRRRYMDEEANLFLVLSGFHAAGTQVWNVYWHLRSLIRVP